MGDAARRLLSAFGEKRVNGLNVAALTAQSRALQASEGLVNTSLKIAPRPAHARHARAMRNYLDSKYRADVTRAGRRLLSGVKRAVQSAHSMYNLFVASSALFRTASLADPTLTLVALAMRPADHFPAGGKVSTISSRTENTDVA